jgi:lysostaphin
MLGVAQSLGKATREAKARSAVQTPTPTPVAQSTGGVSQYQNLPKSLSGFTETTPFMGSTNYEPGGTHKGIDLAMPNQTPLPSFTEGTVTEAISGKGWTPNTPSFGNTVVVTDNLGNKWRYSHLSNEMVKVNDVINKGDIIGLSGGSGSTYSVSNPGQPGYHLDLRIQDAYGKYVSPLSMIQS